MLHAASGQVEISDGLRFAFTFSLPDSRIQASARDDLREGRGLRVRISRTTRSQSEGHYREAVLVVGPSRC
jgi:hypothetical protein